MSSSDPRVPRGPISPAFVVILAFIVVGFAAAVAVWMYWLAAL